MRSLLLACGLTLSASLAAAQRVDPWREVQLPGPARHVSMDTVGVGATVPVSGPDAWAAVRRAYARLQVPTNLVDSARGVLGNLHVVKTYSLGSIPLGRAFDCGAGPSGPLAEQGRLHIAVTTFVAPVGTDSARVHTALVATAESTDGSLRGLSWCATTGAVEDWLLQQVSPRRRRG